MQTRHRPQTCSTNQEPMTLETNIVEMDKEQLGFDTKVTNGGLDSVTAIKEKLYQPWSDEAQGPVKHTTHHLPIHLFVCVLQRGLKNKQIVRKDMQK